MTKKLEKFLSKCSDIILVFLFGSFARGNVTPFSDLDIAIFFSKTTDFYRINVRLGESDESDKSC